MDLNSLRLSDTTTVDLIHPVTDEPVGITITLLAKTSPKVKAVAHRFADKRLAAAVKDGKKAFRLDSAQMEDESLDILVAATEGWTGVERDGQPVPCTPDEVRALYSTPGFAWIREQVDRALSDASNFFPR